MQFLRVFQNFASEGTSYNGMQSFYIEKLGKWLLCNTSILILGQHAVNSHSDHWKNFYERPNSPLEAEITPPYGT